MMSNQDSSSDVPPIAPIPVLPFPLKSIRLELLGSAINFLKDPQVQSAPLSKRLAFLEGKGLTPEEIDLAIIRSTSDTNFELKNYSNMNVPTKTQTSISTSNSNSNIIKNLLLTTAVIIGAGSLLISNYDSVLICENLGFKVSKSKNHENSEQQSESTSRDNDEVSEIKRIEYELKESIKELKELMEEREQSLINRIENVNKIRPIGTGDD